MQADDNNERRRYFRIEDEVILYLKHVKPGEVPDEQGLSEYASTTFSLPSQLDLLTQGSRPQLRRIEREHPDVGDFLRVLEQKIDLIAQALLSRETDLLAQPTRKVSLSASGLAFESDEGFPLGTVLELKMMLPPALIGVRAHGRVVSCRPGNGVQGMHQVAVDFIGLCDRDRELLIRHVVKRQLQLLRDRKRSAN